MKERILSLLLIVLLLGISLVEVHGEVIQIEDYKFYKETSLRYVDANGDTAVGISVDEHVYTWGDGEDGQLGNGLLTTTGTPQDITDKFTLSEGETFVQIVVGGTHMLAYTNENRVFSWGDNTGGCLGDETTTDRLEPIEITANFTFGAGENIIDIAAGMNTSFVLTDAGRIFAWGVNNFGQLGNGSVVTTIGLVVDQTSYYLLQADEELIDIDVSLRSILALSNQGRLYAWGNNLYGQLGTADTTERDFATDITSSLSLGASETITAFSIGAGHSVVATNEGRVLTFGDNNYGQIGDSTGIQRLTPTDISSSMSLGVDEYVVEADAYQHNIVITNEGRVFGWGMNSADQVHENAASPQRTPYEITAYLNYDSDEVITIASTTQSNSLMVSNTDVFYVWGSNTNGLLAQGNLNTSEATGVPIRIDGSFIRFSVQKFLYGNIDFMDMDATSAMAYTKDHRLYVWGDNLYGELGTGTTNRQKTPLDITELVPLHEGEVILAITSGFHHTMMLTSENRVLTSGINFSGELGTTDTTSSTLFQDITSNLPLVEGDYITDIYSGYSYNFLITDLNHIIVFGDNYYGQLGTGNKTDVIAPTDVTSNFSLGIDEEIIDMALGRSHTLVLTSLGNIYAFGENSDGQIGNNSTSDVLNPLIINSYFTIDPADYVVNVETGDAFSGILTNDGRVFTWGDNSSGYLGEGTYTDKLTPYEITIQFDITSGEYIDNLVIGYYHSYAISDTGKVFAFGKNNKAQLGDDTQNSRTLPVQVTSYLDVDTDTISDYILASYSTFLLTQEGNLFGFGENNYNEMGVDSSSLIYYPTLQITKDDQLGILEASYIKEESNIIDSTIDAHLYFRYDLEQIIDSITIDGIDYDTSSMMFDTGELMINIPNTYSLLDTITFHVEEITMSDGRIYTVEGESIFTTTFVEDISPPTFDDIDDQTFEVGGSFDGDTSSFIHNLIDDFDTNITITIDEEINIEKPGVYPVTITATDDSSNTTVQSFVINMVDTTAPSLVYDGPLFIEATTSFDENIISTWIQYTDNVPGNAGVVIDIISTIDTSVPGTYDITYTATDYYGNTDTLIQSVSVVDTTPPTYDVISTQIMEASDIESYDWTLLIQNASDSIPGGVVSTIVSDNVDFNIPGIYTVEVEVEDAFANATSQSFTVIIEDTTAPTIDLIVDQTIEAGMYLDVDWVTLITNYQDNTSTSYATKEVTDNVVYDQVGTYTVEVAVMDASGNETTSLFNVTVEDTTAPLITLNGSDTITIAFGSIYEELGALITDNTNETIDLIIAGDTVNSQAPGTYTITYDAEDESENQAITVIRTIIVTSEDVNLYAALNKGIDTIGIDETHIDEGITYFSDKEVTIIVNDQVDSSAAGTYTITYTITDTADNVLVLTRYVTVTNKPLIVVFKLNDALTTIQLKGTYTDSGCTVKINGISHTCIVDSNTVDTTQAGVYTVTYTYTHDGIEYTYQRFVFVTDGETAIVLYYRKEEEGEFL